MRIKKMTRYQPSKFALDSNFRGKSRFSVNGKRSARTENHEPFTVAFIFLNLIK